MSNDKKPTSPLLLWFYGLVMIFLWLAISGHGMNRLRSMEQQSYSTLLGDQSSHRVMEQGHFLYQSVVVDTGFQPWLLSQTQADGEMGEGFRRFLDFCQSVLINLFQLSVLLFDRLALLLFCLPFWGLILVAAIGDGVLIRKIRYHDFHYSSPLKNLWSRRLCCWLPGLFVYLLLIPLHFPAWLIPAMALLTSICLGWWTANWQKKV